MVLAKKEAQARPYQYCLSVPPPLHGSVVCLSECCHEDQLENGYGKQTIGTLFYLIHQNQDSVYFKTA